MNNRLFGSFAYLCGPMDKAPDGGVEWRVWVSKWLRKRGVFVLDPADKPILNAPPEEVGRRQINEWKESGQFEKIRPEYGESIRGVDLRLCDKADFLITYLNFNIQTCGTWEETFISNKDKKPIVVMCEQGRPAVPNWMWLTLPHDMIFGNWDSLKDYLAMVDNGPEAPHLGRWRFFDWSEIYRRTMEEYNEN